MSLPSTILSQSARQSGWLRIFVPFLALFVGLGTASSVQAQSTINSSSITLNVNGTTTTYNTDTPNGGSNPNFAGNDFGQFNINGSGLTITGGTISFTPAAGSNYDEVDLLIKVYQGTASSTPPTTYVATVPLTNQTPAMSTGPRVYGYTGPALNIVSFATMGGNAPGTSYRFDIRYGIFDNNFNSNPIALATDLVPSVFEVTGSLPVTDTWLGTTNDDWFNSANWSQGFVPDATTDVVIPNFPSGSVAKYPNIYASGNFFVPIATPGATTTFPTGGSTSDAAVRNLLLVGNNSTTDRAIMRLVKGNLTVSGNFTNQYLSFIAREDTRVLFNSSSTQQLGGGSFASVTMAGGGQKNIVGPFNVNQEFAFNSTNDNTVVATDNNNPGTSFIQLADRNAFNNNNGAQLVNETNTSYILGLIQTNRQNVGPNEMETVNGVPTLSPRTFGGLGITMLLTATPVTAGGNTVDIAITRSTTVPNYYIRGTYSVRRVFGVRPSNTAGLVANMTFTTLDAETKNLMPGNASINPANLSLFLSTNGGSSFSQLGRDAAPVTTATPLSYTIAKSGVTTFATFTLGDLTNPLPVQLVAFDAKRAGENALVTWATASETNSSGFEVQVSTTGDSFRKLTWVASANGNSLQRQTYGYTDTESGKSGLRYYRLRQVDLDGKESYSSVKVVNFDKFATAGEAAVAVYPNPFTRDEQATLSIQSPVVGDANLQIMDMAGRTVSTGSISTVAGANEVAVPNVASLSKGIYLVKVTFASGETKTVRMQKQ